MAERLNIHIPWQARHDPASPWGRFFLPLAEALARREDLSVTVTKKATRARRFGTDARAISHHSHFSAPGNLNIKPSYLPGFWYADRTGYSGWSEIVHLAFDPAVIDGRTAQKFYQDRIVDGYLKPGRSKWPQPDRDLPDLPADYVFIPLQVPGDKVLSHGHFSTDRMISAACAGASRRPVVIKPHPLARDPAHRAAVVALHDPARGVHVVAGHIHDLIRRARVVLCQNSGVGMEALLLGKPVITCALSDYHHLTERAQAPEALDHMLDTALAPAPELVAKFAYWFFGCHMICPAASPDTWIDQIAGRLGIGPTTP